MCNSLHKDSKPIPKNGVGWKLFRFYDGILHNIFVNSVYECNSDGSVSWGYAHGYDDSGFCFFLTEKEAKRSKKLLQEVVDYYNNVVLVKIRYDRGLGTHIEKGFIGGRRIKIALCRKFKIHKDNNNFKLVQ